MNTQNIQKYYGSRLDLRLDSSEYYDLQIVRDSINDTIPLTDFPSTGLVIDTTLTGHTCTGVTYSIGDRRHEKGWTLEYVFNRNSLPWISGGTFYYLGSIGSNDPLVYGDNNLSFAFTEDGRIKWSAIHYSGYCTATEYAESYYTTSGQTEPLCTTGLTKDFHVAIVFDRYSRYEDCELENDGGQNDLITGGTLNNDPLDIMTGDTPDYTYSDVLNEKWFDERNRRLGTEKIINVPKVGETNIV